MKMILLPFILLMCACQLRTPLIKAPVRMMASLFGEAQERLDYSHEWELNQDFRYILKNHPRFIKSLHFDLDKNVECLSENVIEANDSKQVSFYLTENSSLRCRSLKPHKLQVNYKLQAFQLKDVSEEQYGMINNILNRPANESLMTILDEIRELGFYDVYNKKMSLAEFRKLPIRPGDYVKIAIGPQLNRVNCPDNNCELDVDVFGPLSYSQMNKLRGINQVKYQELPPFLFFCGTRYAAGNILFRADEKTSFEHIVDKNGFNCEVNHFLISDSIFNYDIIVNWISEEHLENVLLGSVDYFTDQKNTALKNRLQQYLIDLEIINQYVFVSNQLQNSEAERQDPQDNFVELWFEPFNQQCRPFEQQCERAQFVMTRSRLVVTDKNAQRVQELAIPKIGIFQNIKTNQFEVSFSSRVCLDELDQLLLEQLQLGSKTITLDSFKSRLKKYDRACSKRTFQDQSLPWSHRWLLMAKPSNVIIDDEEKVIEDYQILVEPDRKLLNLDPMQKGNIFFQIYLENLKAQKVPFTRPRIIEVKIEN